MAEALNSIRGQVDLVVSTYLEAVGKVGPNWVLVPDGSRLVETFEGENPDEVAKV